MEILGESLPQEGLLEKMFFEPNVGRDNELRVSGGRDFQSREAMTEKGPSTQRCLDNEHMGLKKPVQDLIL